VKSFANLVIALLVIFTPLCVSAEISEQDKAFMRECFALARFAMQRGDHPFGAVLVKDGKIIMRATNSVHTDSDVLRHAETNLIGTAFRSLGKEATKSSILYSSCEPCSMCCGAINLMDGYVTGLVYGLPAQRLVELVGAGNAMPSKPYFKWVGNGIEVRGPVLQAEAEEVIREYLALHHKR
jgi:tRNA(Arg) A34 adenosine deaminase TadA